MSAPRAPDPATLQQLFSLSGKVVLLTGASSGLGARWAPVLAAAGADLLLTARREAELAEVAASAGGAKAVAADLTAPADRDRLVAETLRHFGRIDVLINNAGDAFSAPAEDVPEDRFRALLDLDLTAVFALSAAVSRHMISAGGGSIVNVASLVGLRALDRYPLSAYAAAKAGLIGLTRSLAAEWGAHGVRVNALCPAFFPTRLTGFFEDPEQVEWIVRRTPLGRVPSISELDGPLLFLASDAASFVTGQHLVVDGGWTAY